MNKANKFLVSRPTDPCIQLATISSTFIQSPSGPQICLIIDMSLTSCMEMTRAIFNPLYRNVRVIDIIRWTAWDTSTLSSMIFLPNENFPNATYKSTFETPHSIGWHVAVIFSHSSSIRQGTWLLSCRHITTLSTSCNILRLGKLQSVCKYLSTWVNSLHQHMKYDLYSKNLSNSRTFGSTSIHWQLDDWISSA